MFAEPQQRTDPLASAAQLRSLLAETLTAPVTVVSVGVRISE
jgi:hypothetical protein